MILNDFTDNLEHLLDVTQKTINKLLPESTPSTKEYRDSTLIIDVSGSMYCDDWKPSRLEAAQQAAKAFIKRLRIEEPDARVAIIVYGDDARLCCNLTNVKHYYKLEKCIDSLSDMGCTNITAGLENAYDVLKYSHRFGQAILLTDGCHNTGCSPEPISDKLKERAIVECVGIGGSPADVDEELLRYIASSYPDGSKRYRWIGEKERLVQHFHNLAGRITKA